MSSITLTNKVFVRSARAKSITLERGRVAHLLDKFVFASLLVLIVLVAIPYGTVEPWWISLYECAVFGLAALWIIEGLITGSWQLSEKQLLMPFGALILFTFLQTVTLPPGFTDPISPNSWTTISADPFETRLFALKLLVLAMNGALLVRYTSNPRRMRVLIRVMIGVAVASSLFGIVRYTTQQSEVGFVLPYLRRQSGFAQFVNKNHFAFLIEMVVGLTAGLVISGAVKRERLLFYLSAVVVMWTALVMTVSRGGILSMFSQILFLIGGWISLRSAKNSAAGENQSRSSNCWRLRSSVAGLVLAVGVVTVVALSAIWVGGDVLVTRMQSLPTEIGSEEKLPYAGVRRREVWGATWNLIKAHPFVGSGFGAYGVAITKFHQASGQWIPEAAHNDYLELLASGGAVGVGLITWLGFVFVKRARRQISSSDFFRRAACLGALTGIFGILIHNVVDFGLHVTANAVVFIALVVIATRKTGEGRLTKVQSHYCSACN